MNLLKKLKKKTKRNEDIIRWMIIYMLVWVLSGFTMQIAIAYRIKKDGSYMNWFGDRIIIKNEDVFSK